MKLQFQDAIPTGFFKYCKFNYYKDIVPNGTFFNLPIALYS